MVNSILSKTQKWINNYQWTYFDNEWWDLYKKAAPIKGPPSGADLSLIEQLLINNWSLQKEICIRLPPHHTTKVATKLISN